MVPAKMALSVLVLLCVSAAAWPAPARQARAVPGCAGSSGVNAMPAVRQPTPLVAVGDSITWFCGRSGAWPLLLGRRLGVAAANRATGSNAVVHQYLPEAHAALVDRFASDVVAVPGVRVVLVLEGINDIRYSRAAPGMDRRIIAGLADVVRQAHARGVRISLLTLLPFGADSAFSGATERQRQSVNRWIRTQHARDGVVDCERVMADPVRPLFLRPAYDSGDGIHPNAPGQAALARCAARVLSWQPRARPTQWRRISASRLLAKELDDRIDLRAKVGLHAEAFGRLRDLHLMLHL